MTARASFSIAVHCNLPNLVTVSITETKYTSSGKARPVLLYIAHLPLERLPQQLDRYADRVHQLVHQELGALPPEHAAGL